LAAASADRSVTGFGKADVTDVVDDEAAQWRAQREAERAEQEAAVEAKMQEWLRQAAEKKAKVETPEQIALGKMLSAFNGAVGTMLTPNVVAMVQEVAEKCLIPPVENREPLETKFAEAVGAALDSSIDGLTKAHSDANEVVADEEKKVQSLVDALTESNTLKEKADESLQNANDAEMAATAATDPCTSTVRPACIAT